MLNWIKVWFAKGILKDGLRNKITCWIIRRERKKIEEVGIMEYVRERLSEPSTWRGIIGLVSALGVVLSPEQADKIIAAGIALMGVVNVFRKESKPVEPVK
jgi:hypothetical protein